MEERQYQLGFHPLVGLVYVLCLLTMTMFTVNPLIRLLSLVSGLMLYGLIYGKTKSYPQFRFGFYIIILSGLSNFLFINHGSTKLWQFKFQLFSRWIRLSLTTEAFFYGISFGILLVSLFIWFQCFSVLLPTENLVYLIARPLPKTALVLNLVLTFIPNYLKRLEELKDSQRSLGISKKQSWRERLKFQQHIFVSLFSWSLRDGLVTADSMSARGYGSSQRSHYAQHRFRITDGGMMLILILLVGFIFSFSQRGNYAFYYYPRLRLMNQTISGYLSYLPVACFFFLPQLLVGMEALRWRYYQSKI